MRWIHPFHPSTLDGVKRRPSPFRTAHGQWRLLSDKSSLCCVATVIDHSSAALLVQLGQMPRAHLSAVARMGFASVRRHFPV